VDRPAAVVCPVSPHGNGVGGRCPNVTGSGLVGRAGRKEDDVVTNSDVERLVGAEAVGREGGTIGTIASVHPGEQPDGPGWVSIRTGRAGGREVLAPVAGARVGDDGRLVVAHTRQQVLGAPVAPAAGPPTEGDLEWLNQYYASLAPGLDRVGAGDASGNASGSYYERPVPGTGIADPERVNRRTGAGPDALTAAEASPASDEEVTGRGGDEEGIQRGLD
jgi:hypothetical protein